MLSQSAIRMEGWDARSKLALARSVRLTKLTLTNFRSYDRVEINFDGRPVALAGCNGAGKTNLLEAISLIGPGRGIRSARLSELPRLEGDGGWAVAARIDDGEDERRFGVGATASKPDRRVCRIDDSPVSGPSAFAEHIRFLWLTPAMDRLFMEGASERRRFLDRMTLAHDVEHGKRSTAYEQAMRQRQKLLEEGGRDPNWLAGLERQMAEAGVAIAAARRDMAVRLTNASVCASDGLFPAADIALEGNLETALTTQQVTDVEDAYCEELQRRRRSDRDAGRALSGPHRSDLIVVHRDKQRPARLCSTGEQKALLTGLVLSNARALADERGSAPLILLLDEIAAHLDEGRREGLFDILDALGFQVFMTGTDFELFAAWRGRAQHFEVNANSIREQPIN